MWSSLWMGIRSVSRRWASSCTVKGRRCDHDKKWLLKTHDEDLYNLQSFSTVINTHPDHSWSDLCVSVHVDGFRRRSPRNRIVKSLGTECLSTEQVLSKRSKTKTHSVWIIQTNEPVVCIHFVQGRPEICERSGQANNLVPLQTNIL